MKSNTKSFIWGWVGGMAIGIWVVLWALEPVCDVMNWGAK